MKKLKRVIPIITAFIIGISTTVTAATVFNSKDITYSSDKTTKTNVKDSLDELYSKVGKCPDGWYCYTKPLGLSDKIELGDYISMTPTSTSYTISKDLTGYSEDQTINPSELNLWRVIKKNDDGTVDAVSEYISSEGVILKGKTGYLNGIGVLNAIAAQYINTKYVQSTRHMGYNGQTEFLQDSSKLTQTTAPWNYAEAAANEEFGGGDLGYKDDYNLVKQIYGTTFAFLPSTTKKSAYWLASRLYYLNNRGWLFCLYTVTETRELDNYSPYRYQDNDYVITGLSYKVRPVLTFKSNIELVSGDGTDDSPYILE